MAGRKRQSPQLPQPPAGLPADDRHRAANVLHSAAVRLLRRAAAADRGMDLDGPRASLLSVLVFGGAQTMSQLAERERVTPPAITKLVSALESAGLAARRPSSSDRRVVLVDATDAGRDVLERGRAERVRAVAQLLDGLPAADLATLERAAQIIGERLAAS
ncbi:MarR family winged helix-turn-helix transcriptional regulator [Actinoplanes subtropicus]|uniref:MarR family winged helix-turn-helix transcriptional regulator n=1 Tax=Actinoplanes subtropicus TaxID=543632 RepID=UPI00068B76C7|nr:MarR family transcriptional regulator [Actinoplanes subtropicus]